MNAWIFELASVLCDVEPKKLFELEKFSNYQGSN